MPEISRFFGIVIVMYFNDHAPPHFHARYGKQKAKIRIDPLTVEYSDLPPRALGFTLEWAALHRAELLECFADVMASRSPAKVPPLS